MPSPRGVDDTDLDTALALSLAEADLAAHDKLRHGMDDDDALVMDDYDGGPGVSMSMAGALEEIGMETALEINEAQRQAARRARKGVNPCLRFLADTSVLIEDRYDLLYDDRKRHWPVVVAVLSAAQVAMFVAELVVGGGFAPPAQNWMLGPSAEALVGLGGNVPLYLRQDLWANFYRLIAPVFLHAGVLHIASNLLFQVVFGIALERFWGHWRFALIYLVAGLGGNLCTALLISTSWVVSVGASGSLFGLLGAVCADLWLNWHVMLKPRKQLLYWCLMIVPMLLMGFIPSFVDNITHIGGCFIGFWSALAVLRVIRPPSRVKLFVLHSTGVLVTCTALATGIALLSLGVFNTSPVLCYLFLQTRC